MKLKHIYKLLFFVFTIFTLSSCNNDSDTITQIDASADAQIYSFALAAKAYDAIDSLNYPILAKTSFSVDQDNRLVFNRDSLPFQTKLRNYAVTISYSSSATPSKVELIYADSVAEWNGSDSIDFSLYPKFKVTAANGTSNKEYTIDIRIRKVDPDLINWSKITLAIPSSVKEQKTLMTETDGFYTFSIDNDNQLYLHKTDAEVTKYKTKEVINGISASNIKLETITLLNGKFYAIDNLKNGYISTNGIDWTQKSSDVKSILGILPFTSADKDVLLVITTDGTKDSFTKTSDMENFEPIRELSTFESNGLSFSGFSSVTNYDRSNLNKNILTITSGKKADGSYSNLTWFAQVDESGDFRITSNQQHNRFTAKAGIVSFLYDDYLYVLTDNKLYKSMFADSWNLADDKEQPADMEKEASAQSVIVDNNNYIWIFGGVSDDGGTPVLDIWRGRINKFNP